MILLVDDVPTDGLVVARVDLTAAARLCDKDKLALASPRLLQAEDPQGRPVPFQFVPDPEYDGKTRIAGTAVLRLPSPGPARVRLKTVFRNGMPPPWDGVVTTLAYRVTHDAKRMGGLPGKITFPATGKVFDTFRWNNRLHHRQSGSWCVCDDPQPKVELLDSGPICTAVRVRGHFVQSGKRPPSEPSAVYDWYYFRDLPLVYVTATIRQEKPAAWHEFHFLELNYPREALPRWAAGEPLQQGEFKATMKSHSAAHWGVVHDGQSGVGMFQCGQALFHDGGPGTYLQAHGDAAWQEFSDTLKEFSAWLWIGTSDDPARAVQAAAEAHAGAGRVRVSTAAVRARIEAVAKELDAAGSPRREQDWWRVQGAEQLEAQGRLQEALQVAAGQAPPGWKVVAAGDLSLILQRAEDGIRVLDLFDSRTRQRLVTSKPLPLFSLTLRSAGTREEVRLLAESGWRKTEIAPADPANPGAGAELRWQQPTDKRLTGLRAKARVVPDAEAQSLRWKLAVEGPAAPWSVWRVVFPQVAVADLGPQGAVFFPKAAGEVQRGLWQRTFRFTGTYPSGWTSMQYAAAYDEQRKTGLYVAVHDPWGSTKDVLVESRSSDRSVIVAFDHPVPDMGVPANRFELCGEAVWQLLRGDWFDAAVIYRDWVRREAKWYPKLSPEGRPDTPPWMRDLAVWALSSGTRAECVPGMQEFVKVLGPPVAVHWYNWHQIPFDNDYPHYFPTKPGFAEGVAELQSAGVFVMPYINGRLWDTRDRGKEDFEFTRIARPAVSKNEKGEPYVETYGSKETDGSPVRLGVMCPTTKTWHDKVHGTVLRLMNECGVKGVYIDQIAAAAPTLCFDKSHGHPLGGGHWWTEGYWRLLESIRRDMPKLCMLTTECNGEPYIRSFDGYLTWHWQYDGQVPAFAAVYGGSIQMFGRSYGGGPTRDLALRMRAGQQLVFGEQLGWLAPGVVREKENGAFFGQMVRLRRQLTPYFAAGEMARPPKLAGKMPTVRADWQWGGVDWVTTDAVLTGAWHRPQDHRLALVFVNVADQPVTARLEYDARPYGLPGPEVTLLEITPDGPGERPTTPPVLARDVTFPPRSARAWELGRK
jgi:hypothetical protein